MKKVFSLSLFFMLMVSISIFGAAVNISTSTTWSAITSGTGPGGLPAATDDVTIQNDAVLTVDVSNAVCLSLTAGGGPANSNSTLFFNSGSQLTVSGTVAIGGTASKVGTIDMTNGGTLKCGGFSVGAAAGSWVPGAGTVELTATNTLPTTIFTSFNNLTISGGTTTLNTDIALTGDWTYTSTSNSIGGTGNVSLAGNFTNTNASLDVTTTGFTFNGTSDQTISSASNPADTFSTFGSLTIDNPGTVTLLTNVGAETSFTPTQGTLDLNGNNFYVNGELYTGPLPVELVSFGARINDTNIILVWLTATEVNNYGFQIQRSVQTDKWEVLGFVEGHGNSNSPKEYSFLDSEVNSAGIYSYRLKQIDNDGSYEFSKTIEVNFGSPMNYELSQNYPNPFNPSTTIRFSVLESSFINLSIFNPLGEKIEELVNEIKEPGIHTIEFNAENISSGTYFYRIKTANFTNIKKMVLLK